MPLASIDSVVYEISVPQLKAINKLRKAIKYDSGGPHGEGSRYEGLNELQAHIDKHLPNYKKVGPLSFNTKDF